MLFLLKPREDTKEEAIFFFAVHRRIWNFIIFWNIVEGFDEGIAHWALQITLTARKYLYFKSSFYIMQRKKVIYFCLLFEFFIDQSLLVVYSNFYKCYSLFKVDVKVVLVKVVISYIPTRSLVAESFDV